LLHVVIEDLLGAAAEIAKRIQVTLNQCVDIYAQSELYVSHPGVAEHHAKAVELSGFAIDLNSTAFSPIYLRLDSGFSLIAVYSRDSNFRPHLSHKVLHDCIFAGKSFLLDLAINSLRSERIFLKPADYVFSVAVQLACLL
jgi:hypothetical protein